jgi:N-acetylneuraminic acid mutarotase
MVVFGGQTQNGTTLGDFWVYVHSDRRWARVESSTGPDARRHAAMCVIDGMVYLFGGSDSRDKPLNDLFVFDQSSTTINEINVSYAMGAFGAIAVRSKRSRYVRR